MTTKRGLLSIVVIALTVVGLTACSSGSGNAKSDASAPDSSPSPTGHVARPVSTAPSKSALMICGPEAQKDLGQLFGMTLTEPLAPTWVDHVYSCRYVYPNGVLVVSVKELSNEAETTAYFNQLKQVLGQRGRTINMGQGAFSTKNDSLVVRKDYKVLLADVTGLPAQFGSPPTTRRQAGVAVGITIMGCWTGA